MAAAFEVAHEDYFFEGSDVEGWSTFLETNGFCVIRKQLNVDEVELAKKYIWEDMEQSFDGVKRTDIDTWGGIPNGCAGIMGTTLPQTKGPWVVRSSEAIRSVFAHIWKTDELLVSMDSVLMWLPWWHESSWQPVSEGLHIDQNPYRKPERCCVQGMVPLLDVTDTSGGLEVVPFSHTLDSQANIKGLHPQWQRNVSDWCVIRERHKDSAEPVLLRAKAGDLILWDSRLIHGGKVGDAKQRSIMHPSTVSSPSTDYIHEDNEENEENEEREVRGGGGGGEFMSQEAQRPPDMHDSQIICNKKYTENKI
jgi:hypothetical protein